MVHQVEVEVLLAPEALLEGADLAVKSGVLVVYHKYNLNYNGSYRMDAKGDVEMQDDFATEEVLITVARARLVRTPEQRAQMI